MPDLWPFYYSVAGLIISAIGLLSVGVKLVDYADTIADRFHLGEAFVGGLFLGAITSLSGNIVAGLSAWHGYSHLAINNCLGGIAAQTSFLILADISYRKVNLEHAAASLPNLISCNLLIALLGLSLIGHFIPLPDGLSFHPVSALMLVFYLLGLKWLRQSYENPLWIPKKTKDTKADVPGKDDEGSSAVLLLKFGLSAAVVALLGYVITKSAESLVAQTQLSESVTGGFVTGVITSLPELVVSLVAVRKGALTMAVANILGGNAFDTLMLVLADALSLENSIYSYYGAHEFYMSFINILMTSIIAIGLSRRETKGFGNIGFEGVSVLAIYLGSMALLLSGSIG